MWIKRNIWILTRPFAVGTTLLSQSWRGNSFVGTEKLKNKQSYTIKMKSLRGYVALGIRNEKTGKKFMLNTMGTLKERFDCKSDDISGWFRKINEGQAVEMTVDFENKEIKWKAGKD